jgi:hypothetical protein
LLPRHFSTQTQQLRAASKPFTLNATAFIVVVAVFQVRWAYPASSVTARKVSCNRR